MPSTPYNLHQLSRYLHIPEKQLQKLAEKGDFSARKIDGEWAFVRDNVHRWLEKHIGNSDSQELVGVESSIAKSMHAPNDETVRIADLIPFEAIEIPLQAKTRDSAIRRMTQLAANTGLLWDADKMAEAIKKREELHSTALDNGVALLHPRRPMGEGILGESFISLGITASGIPFGGGFDNLTDVFFLICSLDDRIHLRILARLSRILTAPGFLEKLREAADAADVIYLIKTTEEKIGDVQNPVL